MKNISLKLHPFPIETYTEIKNILIHKSVSCHSIFEYKHFIEIKFKYLTRRIAREYKNDISAFEIKTLHEKLISYKYNKYFSLVIDLLIVHL